MRHIILAFLLTLPALAAAIEYTGKVTSVHDGDTIRILYHDGELKVRLECIDAPELRQPYGERSKQTLSNLVFATGYARPSCQESRSSRLWRRLVGSASEHCLPHQWPMRTRLLIRRPVLR